MFGYIMVNKEELKIKEYDRYQAYYCGLCSTLKKRFKIKGQLLLSYDMTFLAILLTSLYEPKSSITSHRCYTRPLKKCRFVENEYIEYAADMTILLSYQNYIDDWIDDKNFVKYISAAVFKKSYDEVRKKYSRQGASVERYMKRLSLAESKKLYNPDVVSKLTGDMLKEIFVYKDSVWNAELAEIGDYIGRFIYLMDAYEDIDKDLDKSLYNPLTLYKDKPDYDERCKKMLTYMAARAAKAMERLPLLRDVGILRNILYSGMWTRYAAVNLKTDKNVKRAQKRV